MNPVIIEIGIIVGIIFGGLQIFLMLIGKPLIKFKKKEEKKDEKKDEQ